MKTRIVTAVVALAIFIPLIVYGSWPLTIAAVALGIIAMSEILVMKKMFVISFEAIVSYLGVGVQSAPSWGVMIADGQDRLWRGIWWEVAAATGFMFLLVLALNVLGDWLRDRLDPRNRG